MTWRIQTPGGITRRSLLAAAGAATLGCAAPTLVAARANAGTFTEIWHEWGPLAGYGVSAECNPGGGTFTCGAADVQIAPASDATSSYSEVTANPRGILTFVNAIGNIKFITNTPDNQRIALETYQYLYAIRLPRKPTQTSTPWVAEQVHQMIQLWDGSNQIWPANQHTLEAALFWKLNPWDPNYGKIFVYTMDGGNLATFDTGVYLEPDTNWHVFDIRADLANRMYAGMSIDSGNWRDLSGVPLAQVHQPTWGPELALILTAESENAYPGTTNPRVTQWTTQFRDPKLFRLD